jgi:hypothetical protein
VSSSPSPIAELLSQLGRALGELGVRWYLFGAQAAILHGAARLTADVDVTVHAGSRSTSDLASGLARAGFELRVQDIAGFVESTRVLPLVHTATRIPVDVVLAGPGLEEMFLARVESIAIGAETVVPVVSAEDLIAMKVLAGRAKDLADVAAVVRARGPRLDVARVRETLDLLERALNRSDLIPELDRILTLGPQRPTIEDT